WRLPPNRGSFLLARPPDRVVGQGARARGRLEALVVERAQADRGLAIRDPFGDELAHQRAQAEAVAAEPSAHEESLRRLDRPDDRHHVRRALVRPHPDALERSAAQGREYPASSPLDLLHAPPQDLLAEGDPPPVIEH